MDNLQKMLKSISKAQNKVKEIQDKCAQLRTTCEAGAGAVKVTLNGNKELLQIEIEDEFLRPEEKETLQHLIAIAINMAGEAVEEKVQEEFKRSTDGLPDNWLRSE